MKAILLLTVFCICIHLLYAEKVTISGNCDDYPVIGSNRIYNPAKQNAIRRKVIKFPKGIRESDFIIRGFKHHDYEQVPPNVTIVDGKFGDGRIWIKIESQRGFAIKSIFEFCGEKKQ